MEERPTLERERERGREVEREIYFKIDHLQNLYIYMYVSAKEA